MHLRDRGRRHWRAELGKQRVDRRFERLLDGLARLVLREGRQAILERSEIGGKLAADDVVAGGEELAELDVGGAERGERGRELRASFGSSLGVPFAFSWRSGAVMRRKTLSGGGRRTSSGSTRAPDQAMIAPARVSRAILVIAFIDLKAASRSELPRCRR